MLSNLYNQLLGGKNKGKYQLGKLGLGKMDWANGNRERGLREKLWKMSIRENYSWSKLIRENRWKLFQKAFILDRNNMITISILFENYGPLLKEKFFSGEGCKLRNLKLYLLSTFGEAKKIFAGLFMEICLICKGWHV